MIRHELGLCERMAVGIGWRTRLVSLSGLLVAALMAGPTAAQTVNPATRGERNITGNTTLDVDHYGQLNIAAPGITLNCNNKTIRPLPVSFPSSANCADAEGVMRTCLIRNDGRNNVRFINCNIDGGNRADFGIWSEGSGGTVVDDVHVRGTRKAGIHFGGVILGSIVDSSVYEGHRGVELYDTTRSAVQNTDATDNSEIGFYDERGSDNTYFLSAAERNTDAGFYVVEGDGVRIESVLANSSWVGVEFQRSTNLALEDGRMEDNDFGIRVVSCNGGEVVGNYARFNREWDAYQTTNSRGVVWVGNNFLATRNIRNQ